MHFYCSDAESYREIKLKTEKCTPCLSMPAALLMEGQLDITFLVKKMENNVSSATYIIPQRRRFWNILGGHLVFGESYVIILNILFISIIKYDI